jgi:hypothetical protein
MLPGAAAEAITIKQQILEYPSGSALHVTTFTDGRTFDHARAIDGTWVGRDVLPAAGVQVLSVSHSMLGLSVAAITDGTSNTIMICLFARKRVGAVANPPVVLRDLSSGEVLAPSGMRSITLDNYGPGAVLVDAAHLYLPRTAALRGLVLVRRPSGELVLADFDFGTTPVRSTSLGFTAPIGSNKGSFTVAPDGHVWAALASTSSIRLLDLGDLTSMQPLAPVQASSLAAQDFDVESTRVGIIAILIGLMTQPKPVVSYHAGGELVRHVLDDGDLVPLDKQEIPQDSLGLIEEEGIYFYLTPNGELYRGFVGSLAVPFGTIAY